uniref:Uncharacterized protein n=1 Tax=Grammatophora oceanica TaxID=210454 RepID=A0A7S1US29_9STRA|mmetsp:Transcript_19974/g.29599  ORF Transcript_19974/g.29599 Transcript_19974/m.29599 type:complete len:206 (+) Transcript_19974:41-658(+)
MPLSLLLLLAASITLVSGFTPSLQIHRQNVALAMLKDRRQVLAAFGSASLLLVSTGPASAVVMAPGDRGDVFQPGAKLSAEDAKRRFLLARTDMCYLLDHYSEISKEGGDAVRRYLGTVGVTSGMYGITKVLKGLQDEADDIVEYTETMEEFNAYLYQAEGAAYQSLFVEHSSAKGTPESFLATAKQDIVQMKKYMDMLASQLNL